MADKSNDAQESNVKEAIIETMRTNAAAGVYPFKEFTELCLSPAGYHPELARACLAHHAANATARHLLAACDRHSEFWISKLKSVEPDRPGEDGGITVMIAQWAGKGGQEMDGATLRLAAKELAERGWTLVPPPEDQQDDEDRCVISWIGSAGK
jgi:hypothetical protein